MLKSIYISFSNTCKTVVFMKVSLCPRCNSETLDVGTINLSTGKPHEVKVTVHECPKCRLIFYEKASK